MIRFAFRLLLCTTFLPWQMACRPGKASDHSKKSKSNAVQLAAVAPEVAWEIDAARDVYTHKFSKFAFPAQVGLFHRADLVILTEDGRDVTVTYGLPGAVSLAIHLTSIAAVAEYYKLDPKDTFPAFQKYYAGAVAAIREGEDETKSEDDDTLLSQDMVQMTCGGVGIAGMHAEFNGRLGEMETGQALYLFSCNGYFASIEATWPRKQPQSARQELETFFKAFSLPAADKK
ncbi:MAG: hypothetical protein NTX50_26850 [Candidatus Sumerlaeota bacterium]|nr:hypothetical protein [Candidatus Sumerlaeota bacterium]